ncbi:hypothetical protein [Pseudarthrobacter polychromogenes]|uniref:Uncharacterized protein n=1 Tax=Pseudarthrobacter polychromogenes TaxID=1676 RepID=A0ABQ1XWM7_9MICC|nr:hypothetical protein [Pseudarthrobacter polychromogenes]GGH05527.1 hypothetical protein GCM10011577_32240 [Pseudarthrobacter polychromogenes]
MDDLRRTARDLLQRQDRGLVDLWILYWNHGGRCHPFDFDAFVHDVLPVEWFDLGALAVAVEELALESIA